MAYTKQTWSNLPATTSPLSAARLQHIEDGLEAAATVADSASDSAGASAYVVAVQNGFVGSESEWLTSLHGADGDDGADGLFADGVVDVPVTFTDPITFESGLIGTPTITTKSGNYTLTTTDQVVIVDVSGGNVTITVPDASTKAAWVIMVLSGSANHVTVAKTGTDTIDGTTTVASGAWANVVTNGTSTVLVRGN